MASLNKAKLKRLYESGKSIPDLAKHFNKARSTIRYHLLCAGVKLRTRADGVRLSAYKISALHKGRKKGPPSQETRKKLAFARLGIGRGISIRKNGYVEVTMGINKGRPLHDVIMENLLCRRLLPKEVVHHIDKNKHNNLPTNLQVMTSSEHSKLHRMLEKQEKLCQTSIV